MQHINRVTTCLENLEISGNFTTVREPSGILLKVREMSGKNLVRKKWHKTVYCQLHISFIQVFSRSLFCVKY